MSVSMLSEHLVKAGIDVGVFATTANGKTELSVIAGKPANVDGVAVTYFKRITKDHTHFSPSLLIRLWKEAPSFQLIHVHAWWNLVSVLSCLVAVLRNVPVLVSPRGTLSSYSFHNRNISAKWIIHYFIGKFLLNKCAIHVTSEREKDAVIRLIHPESITVLPNFVSLPPRVSYTDVRSSICLRLLFLSRIEEKKGLDLLINALPMVSVTYHLTIAGDGDIAYINHLKSVAAHHQLDDKITWAGFRRDDKFDLIHNNDLFILPSYDENFGNAVIESLSAGTAVLISEQVGLADYVLKNKLGWICQTNPASVSDAINSIALNHGTDLNRIRTIAPGIIYNDFNDDILVKKYTRMYDQLINNDSL